MEGGSLALYAAHGLIVVVIKNHVSVTQIMSFFETKYLNFVKLESELWQFHSRRIRQNILRKLQAALIA